MRFLARDPIPIFLGEAGIGHNHGGSAAQLGKFDVFYLVPPPIALAPTAPPEDGGVVIFAQDCPTDEAPTAQFVVGEEEDSPIVVGSAPARAPEISLFDVVYEEST